MNGIYPQPRGDAECGHNGCKSESPMPHDTANMDRVDRVNWAMWQATQASKVFSIFSTALVTDLGKDDSSSPLFQSGGSFIEQGRTESTNTYNCAPCAARQSHCPWFFPSRSYRTSNFFLLELGQELNGLLFILSLLELFFSFVLELRQELKPSAHSLTCFSQPPC